LIAAIFEGIAWGFLLSVLTGPIFFTIVQVSIEKGFKAGLALVSGQWLSDIIYIGLVIWGSQYMRLLDNDPQFKETLSFYLGSIGAIFLSILGLVLLLTKPKNNSGESLSSSKSNTAFFIQGFLINTLTPFPIFFWISLMSSAIGRGMNIPETISLLITVMLMVILTDLLKVYTARKISTYINAKYTLMLRKLAGLALILSGLIMLLRIFFFNT
jgi:threonine/homoserine/homoserine lactone efflux protein